MKDSHVFWKGRTNRHKRSPPKAYYGVEDDRSKELYEFVKPYIDTNSSILEIGCNVGRNLQYFYEQKCKNITGIEINSYALKEGKKYYPELFKVGTFHDGPAYTVLKQLNSHFELVFTMATLMHMETKEQRYVLNWMAKHSKVICLFEIFDITIPRLSTTGHFINGIKKKAHRILEKNGFTIISELPVEFHDGYKKIKFIKEQLCL